MKKNDSITEKELMKEENENKKETKKEKKEKKEKKGKKEKKFRLGKRLKWVVFVFVIGLAVGVYAGYNIRKAIKEPKVTISYVTGKLEDIGELATEQVTYSSLQQMEEGSIPFIDKKSFLMQYNATLKAGIQMEDMDVKTSKKKVNVTVPHAKILGKPHVDPNSIKFMDEQRALFNWQTKEDTAKAIAMVEKDIEKNDSVDISGLLEKADEHTEELIHKILDDSVGDRKVIVKFE